MNIGKFFAPKTKTTQRSLLSDWGLGTPHAPDVPFDEIADLKDRWYLTGNLSWKKVPCEAHPDWSWDCFCDGGSCGLTDPLYPRPSRSTLKGHIFWDHHDDGPQIWLTSAPLPVDWTDEPIVQAHHASLHGGAQFVEKEWTFLERLKE